MYFILDILDTGAISGSILNGIDKITIAYTIYWNVKVHMANEL